MPRRRGTGYRAAVVGLLLWACALPALGASPLPFTSGFAARVDATFFEGPLPAADRVARYTELLSLRRAELVAVFEADQRARGRKPKAARRKAERRKAVRVYDVLLGDERTPGWLDELAASDDPVAARRLAGRILEVADALEEWGEKPTSKALPENLASLALFDWSVPVGSDPRRADREAVNLVAPGSGEFLEADDLADLLRSGADLSQLDPDPSSPFWRDPGVIAERSIDHTFYGGGQPSLAGQGVRFPAGGATLDKLRRTQTKPKFEVEARLDGEKWRYKLKVGGEIHSETTAGALLAALGFNTDVTRFVRDFRIELGDVDLDRLRDDWRAYFEDNRLHERYVFEDLFEVREDADGPYLVAREASLTAYPGELTRVGPWAWGANGNDARREVRGLALLNVWLGNTDMHEAENNRLLLRRGEHGEQTPFQMVSDVGRSFGGLFGEQVEAYPWDLAQVFPGRVFLHFRSLWDPSVRTRLTWADARWTVRLLGQLTRAQIAEAVRLGGWPEPVGQLLVEKLIHRRNQLVSAFGLVGEPTPSGPLALLDVDRELTTPDGEVAAGALVDGEFDGATRSYASAWEELLQPLAREIGLGATGAFQEGVGSVPVLILSEIFDLPRYVVLRLVFGLERRVEPNPRPSSESDHFLVTDELRVGLTVGGGLGAELTGSLWEAWTLVRPAPTERAAHFADDVILNLRLPWDVARERLPDEYVLLRQSFLEGRFGGLVDSATIGSYTPIGATAGVSRERLSRVAIARKDGELRVFDDTSRGTGADVGAFFDFVFLQVPFANRSARDGALAGRIYRVPLPELDRDPALGAAVARLHAEGDASELARLWPGLPIASDFVRSDSWFRLPWVFGRGTFSRLDRLAVTPGAGSEAQHVLQFRTERTGYWSFLDWGEVFRHVVRGVAPAAAGGGYETPSLVSTYYTRDRDTRDRELGDAYLGFVNGLGSDEQRLIPFTPALHGANGRWGDVEVKVRVGYTPAAVARLRALDVGAFWSDLARALDVPREELARYRRDLDRPGKRGMLARRRVPQRLRGPVLRGTQAMQRLAQARSSDDAAEALELVSSALVAASPWRGGGFDPTLLAALHRQLGPDQVSVEAVVLPPPWIENRFVGHAPLHGESGPADHALPRELIDLDPQCGAAQWEMLDTMPVRVGAGLAWPAAPVAGSGSPCDGSWGSFVR